MVYQLSRAWPCTVDEVMGLSVEEFYSRVAFLKLEAEERKHRG